MLILLEHSEHVNPRPRSTKVISRQLYNIVRHRGLSEQVGLSTMLVVSRSPPRCSSVASSRAMISMPFQARCPVPVTKHESPSSDSGAVAKRPSLLWKGGSRIAVVVDAGNQCDLSLSLLVGSGIV